MTKPSTHLFEVSVTFRNLPSDETFLELNLPVWRPGRYLIFDFASSIQEFNAFDINGTPLKWKKINKNTWRIELNQSKTVTAKYKVYANEFNLRTRGLNDEHAFIDGTSVFMYSEKYRSSPIVLKINPYNGWHVTTGLDNYGSSSFLTAPGYDYFADCPLEIGTQKDIEFNIGNRKHIISIFGPERCNEDTLVNDFTKIIKKNYEFWGKIPYEKYVFIIHFIPYGGGGTEHINSCILDVNPAALCENTSSVRNAIYKNFLGLVSHEFFHTWNVKQLRPKGLTPYDYTKENYTEELWLAEGGTSYYSGLLLARIGLNDKEDFYGQIAKAVQEERRRPGNRIQSLAESSFDAWIKYWKNTPQSYNAETDYYGKGTDVCLILDLELRQRTKNKRSLDDVFRTMYERFPLGVNGYTNFDFQKICEEISGTSFEQFFNDYVYGTKPVEWEKFLSYAGLDLRAKDSTISPVIGILTEQKGGKIIIRDVVSGSYAEEAGITTDDEIVALNRERISYVELNKKLDGLQRGDSLTLTIFRNDKLKDFTLALQRRKFANYFISEFENPTALQELIRKSWLEIK